MKLVWFIAKRYLLAKKSHNVINIISIISVAGVTVGTMGLIIVLSVFNGFSDLVVSLYNSFDPDIRITAVEGKTFDPSRSGISEIKKLEEVESVSYTLMENALIKYRDRQSIVTIKGVEKNFDEIAAIKDKIVDGEFLLEKDHVPYAIVGSTIAYTLSLSMEDPFNQLSIYVPRKGKPVSMLNPNDAFNIRLIRPSGIFAIQQDFDSKYVIVPLEFAREVIGHEKNVSAIEVNLREGSDEELAKERIASVLKGNVKVETRLQQHEFLYKILKSEKWAVYFILSFIIVIAVFNITGSLTMLIIEKKKDISVLRSLGAENTLIRNIFVVEGLLITLSGAVTGLLAGALVCFLQQQFGFIRLDDGEAFVIEAYPVSMMAGDFIAVLGIVFIIGLAAAFYTSQKLVLSTRLQLH